MSPALSDQMTESGVGVNYLVGLMIVLWIEFEDFGFFCVLEIPC